MLESQKRTTLVLFLIATLLLAAAPTTNPNKPVQTKGNYEATVGGFYHGKGVATVTDTEVNIHIGVDSDDGTHGMLIANNLTIARGHFRGVGHIGAEQFTISGRLDQTKNARLAAHFTTDGGHTGQIVGISTGAPKPNDPLD